jgi:heat shock protein HtpX
MHGFRNTFKTFVLLAGLGGLMVVVGSFFGRGGAIIGFALGLLTVGISYWKSDAIALRSAGAVPADERAMPEYFRIVRELSAQAGIPMPRLYVTPDAQPNAFATGRNPEHAAVAVTAGILQILTWDELRAVLAHELSHVANRDILIGSIAAGIAMSITFIARMVMFGALFGGGRDDRDSPLGGIGALLAVILAPVAAALIQLAVTRSREFRADQSGAYLSHDPEALASALRKIEAASKQAPAPAQLSPATAHLFIVNPFKGKAAAQGFANLFSTHPPTEARIARLQEIKQNL